MVVQCAFHLYYWFHWIRRIWRKSFFSVSAYLQEATESCNTHVHNIKRKSTEPAHARMCHFAASANMPASQSLNVTNQRQKATITHTPPRCSGNGNHFPNFITIITVSHSRWQCLVTPSYGHNNNHNRRIFGRLSSPPAPNNNLSTSLSLSHCLNHSCNEFYCVL